ncbi:hypothetical protein [Scytonema sp. NUACC21]
MMKLLYLSAICITAAAIVALRHNQSYTSSMCPSNDNTSWNRVFSEESAYNFLVESDRSFN